jgi:hypothetical protein
MGNSKSAGGTGADTDPEDQRVHAWRVSQLVQLGLPCSAADAAADTVDWHDVARLVKRGCTAELAVAILN